MKMRRKNSLELDELSFGRYIGLWTESTSNQPMSLVVKNKA